MVVVYRCGHSSTLSDRTLGLPPCPTCGEVLASRVDVRPPKIRGVASGPHCEHRDLPAIAVSLAPAGPLIRGTNDG